MERSKLFGMTKRRQMMCILAIVLVLFRQFPSLHRFEIQLETQEQKPATSTTKISSTNHHISSSLNLTLNSSTPKVEASSPTVFDQTATASIETAAPASFQTPTFSMEENKTKQSPVTIVISMSLCINLRPSTLKADRREKPYDLAIAYATRLWLQLMPGLQVVTLLAHTSRGDNETAAALEIISNRIRAAGGHFLLYNITKEFPNKSHDEADAACLKAGQMGRTFLYEQGRDSLLPRILGEDDVSRHWIVTSDADAFPLNEKLLQDTLRTNRLGQPYRAWVSNTARVLKTNHSWPMCFIGMSIGEWKETMMPWTLTTAIKQQLAANSTQLAWDGDQILLTSQILNRGHCSLPRAHGAWDFPYISPERRQSNALNDDDTLTCSKSEQGNKRLCKWPRIEYSWNRCHWLHFLPRVTGTDFYNAYNKIGKKRNANFISAEQLLGSYPQHGYSAMLRNLTNFSTLSADSKTRDNNTSAATSRTIVISQSLCVQPSSNSSSSSTAPMATRVSKPYDLASVYSTRLWKQQNPDLKVVTMLAHYSTTADEEASLRLTRKRIEQAGGIVWMYNVTHLLPDTADRNTTRDVCVKAGQLGRVFLHAANNSLVAPNDIIVTSDVDAFPIRAKKLLAPLQERDSNGDYYRVWIQNTQTALRNNHSWPMCFIGMSTTDWGEAMAPTTLDTAIRDQVDPDLPNWFYGDQFLVTAQILNRGLCRLPRSHGAWWNNRYITRRPELLSDDNDHNQTCLQPPLGLVARTNWQGAKTQLKAKHQWIHFLPDADANDFQQAYTRLANRKPNPIPAEMLLNIG